MPGETLARVRGLPNSPSITEVNVRPGPGTNQDLIFKVPVGMSGVLILEVQPDVEGKNLNGKIYQWFKLQFDGGAIGWIRDDLLEVQGDLTAYGYPDLSELTVGFALTRQIEAQPAPESTSAEPVATTVTEPLATVTAAATSATGDFPDALADTERVRKASFRITSTFEGTGYAAYNNYDAGIVSYGLIQFTLAAGSLVTVVNRYLERSQSDQANVLRSYQERTNARDSLLRNDMGFKNALIAAAGDSIMQAVQDEVATEGYWKAVVDGYITHRGLRLPLTWALLFDMGVNFGVNHGFVRLAEKQLNVEPRSRPGENGISEEQLTTHIAQLRKASHDRQAERDNLPGLKVRGDFWMNLALSGDWYLRGNSSGNVNIGGGLLNVLNP